MHQTIAGMCLLILAGTMNASFAAPMKFVRSWVWENTWLLWSLFALLLLPFALAFSTIPHFGSILSAASEVTCLVVVFGAAWGIAQVLFGLALERIGIALTFSIVLGLSAAMGALIPLVSQHRDRVFTRSGTISLAGIVLVLLGVALSAVAGKIRDRVRNAGALQSAHFGSGLLMAVVAGICASMMNVGFSYGAPLMQAAIAHGAASQWATDVVWAPLLAGGAVPNILYCLYLLSKNKTGKNYSSPDTARNAGLAFVMAILWFGSSILYGVATLLLGDLGAVVGWPLFMSLIVIVASVIGILTGEWKAAGHHALRVQALAVLVLVFAVVVLSRATL